MNKSYSNLIKFPTYEERLEYLKLDSSIGIETFGSKRHLNQILYKSIEWKRLRDSIIIRDCGCDLGIEDRPIHKDTKLFVHHINPIMPYDDIEKLFFDGNNLITVSFKTHNYIHFGARNNNDLYFERTENDTIPWRNANGRINT